MTQDPEGKSGDVPRQEQIGQLDQEVESTRSEGTPERSEQEKGLGLTQEPTQVQEAPKTDRWHGKSREEVIHLLENTESILAEAATKAAKADQYEQYLRQLASQQQVRTTSPERQPSYVPSHTTGDKRQQLQHAFEKGIEGDYQPFEEILTKTTDERVYQKLNEVLQYNQVQYTQQVQQQLNQLDAYADIEMRKYAAEKGTSYQHVRKTVMDALNNKPEVLAELRNQPWNFDERRIKQGVRELFDEIEVSEESKMDKYFKKRGLTLDSAKQYLEAQKAVASNAVPDSGRSQPGSNQGTSQFTKEEEQELQRLNLGLD